MIRIDNLRSCLFATCEVNVESLPLSVNCTGSVSDSTIIENITFEIGKEWCKMYVCIDYYDKNEVRLSRYACFNMLGYRIEYDSKFGYVWFHLQHKIKYNLMLMSVKKI